ncbi:MAG: hypothetical protein IPL43_11745 [Micropruina sp.]|nr:hypothetical protein [Micropruina sp.]
MTAPPSPDPAVRSDPPTMAERTRCALATALTNLTPPPSQWWARRAPLAAVLVTFLAGVSALAVIADLPWALAAIAAAVLIVGAHTVAFIVPDLIHRRHTTMWRAYHGHATAVCVTQWNPRRARHELHSWAAFPRGRGLGGPVARTAIAGTPRPLWLHPATASLRELYRTHGFLDHPGTSWMVLPQHNNHPQHPQPPARG